MKKLSFVCLIMFFFSLTVFCSSGVLISDTSTLPKKEFKLNKKEFLAKYGTDDTSTALIRYWFLSRSLNNLLVFGSGAVFAASGTGLTISLLQSPPGELNTAAGGQILLGIVAVASGLILVASGYSLIKWSRKKLLQILKSYQSNQPLPDKIQKELKPFLKK